MMATKKAIELDARLEAIIREEYAEFKTYLPMPQEKAMYDRKQNEYWDRIHARVKEGELIDGRTADE
ncbi:MAG: hypothetical protein IJS28_07335 [Synergistaceae bacterium]|nr:hypothetical protein [Synergistaceae bacterium]